MGKLFANSKMAPPAAAMAAPPSSAGPAVANHTAGIFADMTVDGEEIGTLVVVVDRAKNLPNLKTMGKQDPYCAARLGKEAQKTETDRRGGQTPRWDQELRFTVRDGADYGRLKVSVFNDDKRTDLIGETWIMLDNVLNPGGGAADSWHHLSKAGRYAGEIRIELTYYDTRPKLEKAKRTKQPEPEEVQRAAHMAGPRDLPQVKRRPLPTIGGGAQSAATAGALPSPSLGPRSYHTPPRQHSPEADEQPPLQNGHYPESPDDYGRYDDSPIPQQHAYSHSAPDIHAHLQQHVMQSDGHSMYAPEVDQSRQHRLSHDAYGQGYSEDPEPAFHQQPDPFAYSDDPYALQVADVAQEEHYRGRHASEPPMQQQQQQQQQQQPPYLRHDRVHALAHDQPQPSRPLPQAAHSDPALGASSQAYGLGVHTQDDYHYHAPASVLAPQGLHGHPSQSPMQNMHSYDDFHSEPHGFAPRPPRHNNSIPLPQHASRPAPVHYNSQPIRPTGQPPYPRDRQSFDPSSEHAAHLRTQYAAISKPSYPPQQQAPPPQPRAIAAPSQSHTQDHYYRERRHSAVDPDYYMRPQPHPQHPYGHAPAPNPGGPQHGYSQSYSAQAPRPAFQQSAASSAALRNPHPQPLHHAHRDITPNSHERLEQSPREHRVSESFAGVPVVRPQPHRVVSPQSANLPVIINGTAAAGTRAAPIYVTPTKQTYNIARRSISPHPSTDAIGDHYSPDSFDIYNPSSSGRNEHVDNSPLAHRAPSPMYGNPDGSHSAPELTAPPPRTTADGNVILSDGQVVHPSDHIPASAWAPEPERKEKRPTVAVNIRNRFGPREARALDKQSNTVIATPLAGAGMRKQANEPSSMVNLTNNVRVVPKRQQGPLKPGSTNALIPPPIPAKVPGESALEEEMRNIDLGPKRLNRGWGRGNRFGV